MTRTVLIDASEQTVRLLESFTLADDFYVHAGDPDTDAMRDLLADARTVLNGHTYMTAEDLAHAPHLRQIVFLGTGASSYIDMEAAKARGIRVDIVKGYGDEAVAQHAIALALAGLRQVATMDRAIRQGIWQPLGGREFADLTFGVVGMGGIGRATAKLAQALGFRTLGWNRSELSDAPCPLLPMPDLLAQSDVLSLHLALNPQTAGMIDAAALARLPPEAILVNTSRAGLIDTPAMLDALTRGQLSHAALDVFDLEPLPMTSPLIGMENVTLTAHAAFKTDAAMRKLLQMALDLVMP